MAKTSVPRPTPKKKKPAPPSLADVAITWKDPSGLTLMVPGAAVARIAYFYSRRRPLETFMGVADDSLRALPMMRGLSGVIFPDAGTPTAEIEADQRFFVSEALADLAASLEADQGYSHDLVRGMTLKVERGIGLRTMPARAKR